MFAQTTTSMPSIELVVNPIVGAPTPWAEIILGGAIGGLVVVTGVLLAEWLARSRNRRTKVQSVVSDMAFNMPILNAYYSDEPDAPRLEPGDYHGEFWRLRKDVMAGLNYLRTLPRWPMKNARQIRDNAELLITLLTAVSIRATRGLRLSRDEQVAIAAHDRLHKLVFGTEPVPEEVLNRCVDEGFSMPADQA